MAHICAGSLSGTPLLIRRPIQIRPAQVQQPAQCRLRNPNTDKTKIPQFKRNTTDTGSTEVQVAQLSARIVQLTVHLQVHRRDFATRRGLLTILATRKSLMQYLWKKDRPMYDRLIKELGIRPLKVQAGRNVMIRLEEGAEPEKIHMTDAEAEAGQEQQ